MNYSARTIQEDFDRIALLQADDASHYDHYQKYLLKQIPSHCENVLEIGCGTGAFSRLLAKRADRIVAIDLSPNMIEVAREQSRNYPNIYYSVADALEMELTPEQYDCIVSIATLHHMPIEKIVLRMKQSLKVKGTLLVLDLFQREGFLDFIRDVPAYAVKVFLNLIKRGRLRTPRHVREAWAEHAKNDTYLTVSRVREICADLLPGAKVRKHLLWRYSIVWKKGH
jgi:ubiquinone/menaquinone biosynthesis C-methylase UbiE